MVTATEVWKPLWQHHTESLPRSLIRDPLYCTIFYLRHELVFCRGTTCGVTRHMHGHQLIYSLVSVGKLDLYYSITKPYRVFFSRQNCIQITLLSWVSNDNYRDLQVILRKLKSFRTLNKQTYITSQLARMLYTP